MAAMKRGLAFVWLAALCVVVAGGAQAGPLMTGTQPADGESGVAPGAPVWVDFTGDIDEDSVQFTINGLAVHPLRQPFSGGLRFIATPGDMLPLTTVRVTCSVTAAGDPDDRSQVSFSYNLGSWTDRLDIPGFDGHPLGGADLAVGSDGVQHLAFIDDHRLYYMTISDGLPGIPMLLDTRAYKRPVLRRDLLDAIHLLWFSMEEDGLIKYTNNISGEFMEPVVFYVWMLADNTTQPFDLAVDYQRMAHIVWFEENWDVSDLYYSYVVPHTPPDIITVHTGLRPYFEPRVAINFTNRPHVVWRIKDNNYDKVFWTRKAPGGGFESPRLISTESRAVMRNLAFRIGPDGISNVLWEEWPEFGPMHHLVHAADANYRGTFDLEDRIAGLAETFRFRTGFLFPSRLYVMCHADSGIYFMENDNGRFGVLERISPLRVEGVALHVEADMSMTACWYGDEAAGLRLMYHRPAAHRPAILAAGWLDSYISAAAGGTLTMAVLVRDAGGDDNRLQVRIGGLETGMELTEREDLGGGITLYRQVVTVPPGVSPGRYDVELTAWDETGAVGPVWPYLKVAPAPLYWGQASTPANGWFEPLAGAIARTEPKTATARILAGGFWDSAPVSSAAGPVTMTALLEPGVPAVVFAHLGADVIGELHDDGMNGDDRAGDGLHTLRLDLPAGVPWGDYRVEFTAVGGQGDSYSWPSLEILP
ncbi:hypothetical protein JW905_06070 [bacterium]|nr:hypothetical protein [candidate division CSSED10-310 bacterium]